MTLRQEATMLINDLPDDTVKVVVELLRKLNSNMAEEEVKPKTLNRFDIETGKLRSNDEVAISLALNG